MQITECNRDDLPLLQKFIDQHWRKGHILSQQQSVLEWYYGTPTGYNFLLAKRDGEIFAVLGYIDSDRFYSQKSAQSELWLALWKVREDANVPGLGLRLILELKKRYPQRLISVLGLSDDASKIYRLLRYQVHTLDQLFIYNRQLDSYRLLQGDLPDFECPSFQGNVRLVNDCGQLYTDANRINDSRCRGAEYFIQRYLNNPFNTYQLFRIEQYDQVGYAIGRVVSAEGRSALRLVDFFGQLSVLGLALGWFELYLQQQGLEYMDLYLYSEQVSHLEQFGFINRNDCAEDVIVPNYFDPFVTKNIDLQCAFEKGFNGSIFKADGDQERPNYINNI